MADLIVMSEMTWAEVDEAMKDRPVGILPVGAIEAHGPHLPLNADTVIAIEMAKRGAAKLKEHGVSALILPPVSLSLADRKSTRLNSSHLGISYAVFCLKKKNTLHPAN